MKNLTGKYFSRLLWLRKTSAYSPAYPAIPLQGAVSGQISGSATLAFSGTGDLRGKGALLSVAALVIGGSATINADGALAGTSTLVFGNAALLTADGALAGAAALVFGASATPNTPSGAISGTAVIAFTGSATINADGLLLGTAALTFDATGDLTGIAAPVADGQPSPVGHPVYRRPRKSAKQLLDELLDRTAKELYEEIIEEAPPAVRQEAGAVVRPLAKSEKAVPAPSSVDWKAVERDVKKVRELIELWRKELRERELEEDDEEVLLLV